MIKFACFLSAILLIFCLNAASLSAQEDINKLKSQLMEVKKQIALTTNAHKQALADVKKECDNKISAAKKEFHKIRDQYIAERVAEEKELEAAYNNKVLPLQTQEKQLVNKIEPLEPNNWVKR